MAWVGKVMLYDAHARDTLRSAPHEVIDLETPLDPARVRKQKSAIQNPEVNQGDGRAQRNP
jgi:hypothetical protein